MVAVPTDPFVGEGVLSVLTRAASANGYRTLHRFLKPSGLHIRGPKSHLKIGSDAAKRLAKKIGATDIAAVQQLFWRPIPGRPLWTDFWGTPIRSMYLARGKRGGSPPAGWLLSVTSLRCGRSRCSDLTRLPRRS
jgi:hypothetical protein